MAGSYKSELHPYLVNELYIERVALMRDSSFPFDRNQKCKVSLSR